MSKVIYHYDVMEALWNLYLNEDIGGSLGNFVNFSVGKFYMLNGDPLSANDLITIWQSFDMLYEKAFEGARRNEG